MQRLTHMVCIVGLQSQGDSHFQQVIAVSKNPPKDLGSTCLQLDELGKWVYISVIVPPEVVRANHPGNPMEHLCCKSTPKIWQYLAAHKFLIQFRNPLRPYSGHESLNLEDQDGGRENACRCLHRDANTEQIGGSQ